MDSSHYDLIFRDMIVTLSRISDARQRSFSLADRLRRFEDDLIVYCLRTIRERSLMGEPDCQLLYNSLMVSGTFSEVFDQVRLSAIVESLQSSQEYELVAILMDVPPEGQDESPFQPYLDVRLREVPLGMRKSLARKPDFKLIKRIARDQDHRVIRHLLDNPRLTEMDVVQIGSTRPTSPKVIETIYNHPRWINRYSIKKVIVMNPSSPLAMSMRLLTYMNLQDLQEIVESPNLPSVLVREAIRILGKKNANLCEYRLDPRPTETEEILEYD
ncbi:hypothetical protein [Desulfomonile tiedjei]|uniref:Uncharacterized protein n=1 Tax=Desulfomonile tiedjei (strain ATCC 49306 / DSM 6799 / DCB-1) TaxID=706587 RepID=I4C7K9_DESTA|nr:hypothetical protein [Desulfomonile tiedjei]AFM25550.1 hypothetical protein Desti_2881 [Desulfomonile tiedjei DSM 6799]